MVRAANMKIVNISGGGCAEMVNGSGVSVSEIHSAALVSALKDGGIGDVAQIGDIFNGPEKEIWVV